MSNIPSLESMLSSGLHFGHRASRWHPKMEPYIFGERSGIHIVNLETTQKKLEEVAKFIDSVIARNGVIMFVGTKAQAKEAVKAQAIRAGMPYIVNRWLGGFLTNFGNVGKLAKRLNDLTRQRDTGELNKYTKKEQLDFVREIERLETLAGGFRNIEKIPDVIFVVDIKTEKTVLQEANKRGVPVIALCDTNVNPDGVDYIIPGNDDSLKGIELVCTAIADMILEAKAKAASAPAKK